MTRLRRDEMTNWKEVSMEEILVRAIADEESERDYYKHAAECAVSPHTQRVLLELSAMEQGHADKLRGEVVMLHSSRK